MGFQLTKPPPRSDPPSSHLDRWVIMAGNMSTGIQWVNANLVVLVKDKGVPKIVTPVFDYDPFQVRIITAETSLDHNMIQYYELVDVRSKLERLHDEVKEKDPYQRVLDLLVRRPERVCQHPHPEPPFNQQEIDRGSYLRRRWIAPDPVYDPGEHDQHGLADECGGMAPPEWLRRRR